MQLNIMIFLAFTIALILSLCLTPIVIKVGDELNVIAKTNNRTIHSGRMVRIGGLAIYISFMLTSMLFLKADKQINSILIGGFIVMLSGLLDDLMDLKPIYKLIFQLIAVVIVVAYGNIRLKAIGLPFGISINFGAISMFITAVWIIGITNAINLMDGLDGLSAGISSIMLATIALLSLQDGRSDIAIISLILIGASLGFLKYNFYPAQVFLGDVGALFLGFMISVISLFGFGFKSATFISLLPPIFILAIPIIDTLVAIIRRRLRGKKFSEADRSHLHHVLMFRMSLGHRNTVLVLYFATFLFSIGAYLVTINKVVGLVVILVLMLMLELVIEYTGMLNKKYHPILSLLGIRRRKNGKSKQRRNTNS